MTEESRKATDVLLDLEKKVDLLLNIVRNQDLNLKILSNKLNSLLNNKNQINNAPSITAEPVNMAKEIFVQAEEQPSVDLNPVGFRRTSRPESYTGVVPKKDIKTPQQAEVIVDVPSKQPQVVEQDFVTRTELLNPGSVSVEQRVVDKNSKSIFLADVEITDVKTGNKVSKTRTNGMGKWTAALPVGNYKILVGKRDSTSKERLEAVQDLNVDGSTSPLKLKTLVFK